MGAVASVDGLPHVRSGSELLSRFDALRTVRDQRTLLVRALIDSPSSVRDVWRDLLPVRVAEAVSHLSAERTVDAKDEVLALLLEMFRESFSDMGGNTKTVFRKTVALVDHRLFAI